MDFHSLTRRQLQSLCKLNRIPANVTNIAMADALGSLDTVQGIEEILNHLQSESVKSSTESPEKIEVTSPRVPRTSYRTTIRQKVQKTDGEDLPATLSRKVGRGVRRQLGGEANEFMKTPMVSSTRKKAAETVKKESTVQTVYNTRRSARLAEKRSLETGVMGREVSQPVKIGLFVEEVSAKSEEDSGSFVSEISAGSGSGFMETSHESNVASENTEDKDVEESVENSVVGVSNAKVEDICNAFKKLDVEAVDRSDQDLTVETGLDVDTTPEGGEEKVDILKVESVEVFEQPDTSEAVDVDIITHESDQNLTVEKALDVDITLESVEEKVDCSKVESVEVFEQHETVDLNETQIDGEKFVLNDVDNSDETNGQMDNPKPDSEGVFSPNEEGGSEESFVVVDEEDDLNEELNDSDKEQIVNLLVDIPKPDSEGISSPCLDGNSEESFVVVDEKPDLNEALNDSVKEQNVYFQVNNLKPDSEGIFNPCGVEDSEEMLEVVDEKNSLNEALNNPGEEQNVYFQVENQKLELEGISNLCEDRDSEEMLEVVDEKHSLNEALNNAVEEQNVSFQVDNQNPESEVVSNLCDDIDSNEGLHIPVMEQNVYSQVENLKPDLEGISNPCEDGDSEENLIAVDEKYDMNEASSVSVKEQNVYLAPEEHSDSLLYDETSFLSETDDIDVDAVSHDTENSNDHSQLESEDMSSDVSETMNETSVCIGSPTMVVDSINFNTETPSELLKLSETDDTDADADSYDSENSNEQSDSKFKNIFSAVVSEMTNEISECIGSPNMMVDSIDFITETSELSKLDNPDSHNVAKDLTADGIEENISTNTGSSDMVGGLIHSSTAIPTVLELESPENNTVATEITADGIEDNISAHTVDVVFVNPNEPELSMGFSAPVEAHESLIDETAAGCKLDAGSEQVNQEAEQIIADGDKVKHESVADAVLVNSNEPERGMELLAPVAAQNSLINETAVDCELDHGSDQFNQEAGQIIADGDNVKHESVVDGSYFKENKFSTNANDVNEDPTYFTLKKHTVNNIPTSVMVTTQVSEDSENSGRMLQAAVGEEVQSINEKIADEKPKSLNEYSIRQLKKQLKALYISKNMNTNKDDKVVEARPALQAKCDNQLATNETEN